MVACKGDARQCAAGRMSRARMIPGRRPRDRPPAASPVHCPTASSPASMRLLLIRLLLLALCFHTVVGRPAHEASHFVQAIEQAARSPVQLAFGDGVELDEAEPDVNGNGAGSVDGLCAWCLAFAHSAHFAAVADGAWPPSLAGAAASQPAPPLAIGFLPGLDRWRFSARDPPGVASRG